MILFFYIIIYCILEMYKQIICIFLNSTIKCIIVYYIGTYIILIRAILEIAVYLI